MCDAINRVLDLGRLRGIEGQLSPEGRFAVAGVAGVGIAIISAMAGRPRFDSLASALTLGQRAVVWTAVIHLGLCGWQYTQYSANFRIFRQDQERQV